MAISQMNEVLEHLRRAVLLQDGAGLTDAQLLGRFIEHRDEAAFAALVKRHGAMVWGVCRRVLCNHHDAEDAFQVTFLVLVRKAASIFPRKMVSNWLYGVAHQTALKAMATKARRRTRERQVVQMPEPAVAAQDLWHDLQPLLDQELSRLPDKYRVAVVLCDLEGKTRKEAARLLGLPEGTVGSRLARARTMLAKRLARYGLAVSGGAVATLLSQEAASASVPPSVVSSTIKTAMLVAAGQVTATNLISARVAILTEGVLKAMLLSEIKVVMGMPFTKAQLALALFMTFGMIAAGAGLAAYQTKNDDRSEEGKASQSNEVARAEPAATVRQQDLPRTDRYGDPLPAGALARLGTIRLRNDYSTLCVAFTRDGKTVLTSDARPVYTPRARGTIVYCDVATGRPLRRLQTSLGSIHALAVSPDGKTLAAGGSGGIALWDVATGRQTGQGPVNNNPVNNNKGEWSEDAVRALAFSPDGKTLAVRDRGKIAYLWDVGTASVAHRLAGHRGNLTSIAFSPDGKLVASGAWEDPVVRLWDPATGNEVRQLKVAHQGTVFSVAFSPNGKELAIGCNNDPVRFWDLATGERLRDAEDHLSTDHRPDYTLATHATQLCYYPDGKKLAGIASFRLVVWDTATGKLLFWGEDDPRPHDKDCLIIAPDGKTVAASPDWRGGSHTIELWDAATGKLQHHQGHCEGVRALGFTDGGRSLCSAASSVLIWDSLTGQEQRRIDEAYRTLTLSADGRFLVAPAHEPATVPVPVGPDDAVGFWEVATGAEVRRIKGHTTSLNPVCLSADGKTLAWSSLEGKKAIFVYSAESGTEQRVIPLDRWPHPMALSPDGRTVAAGGFLDGAVRLWDTATGKERRRVGTPPYLHPDAIAFSPDGRALATGGSEFGRSEFACLWDPASGKLLRRFGSPGDRIRSLGFSPDGRTLATLGSERSARLWEVASGGQRASFIGHQGQINAVAFSPDGTRLATGSEDTTILVWDVASRWLAGPAPEIRLSSREINVLWTDLGGRDAVRAHRAVWALAAAPDQTVAFLRERLKPASPPDPVRMARLITELGNDRFAVRREAADELARMGNLAEPFLRKVLAARPSLEVWHRVEQILASLETTPQFLQKLRGIEALEHIGTLAAMQALEALSKGAPEARLTQEAKASLKRLATRPAAKP